MAPLLIAPLGGNHSKLRALSAVISATSQHDVNNIMVAPGERIFGP
jgi:hypothetical protein